MEKQRGRPKGSGNGHPPTGGYRTPSGSRVTAFRIPAEFRDELDVRSARRGITLQAYIRNALYDYMQKEDAIKALRAAKIEAAKGEAK